jgi:hypothetical protein
MLAGTGPATVRLTEQVTAAHDHHADTRLPQTLRPASLGLVNRSANPLIVHLTILSGGG